MTGTGTQRLCLPYAQQVLLTGYKSAICRRTFGYLHFGLDIAARGDRTLRAGGEGIVLACGRDRLFGGALVILYPDCAGIGGEASTLTARYMHLRDVLVRTGDRVAPGMPVGIEGAEGTGEPHTHFELDADISCPCRTPQAGSGHTFWHTGKDTTVDPALWLSAAPGQAILPTPVSPEWLGFSGNALAQRCGVQAPPAEGCTADAV